MIKNVISVIKISSTFLKIEHNNIVMVTLLYNSYSYIHIVLNSEYYLKTKEQNILNITMLLKLNS